MTTRNSKGYRLKERRLSFAEAVVIVVVGMIGGFVIWSGVRFVFYPFLR